MNTSALLTICFSREQTLLGRLRPTGAALGSEALRPRTAPLGDSPDVTRHVASTQTLHPYHHVINCAHVRMLGPTITIITQIRRTGTNRPVIVILPLLRAGVRRAGGAFLPGDQGFSRARSMLMIAV